MSIAELRRDYAGRPLRREDLDADPVKQFQHWFREALETDVPDANAMALATVSPDGVPSVRTVLLKEIDQRGAVFYTNYGSAKGRDLAANPQASIVFYWTPLSRQVGITGVTEKVSREESEAYFHSRPRGSQLAALASHQSAPLASRQELEDELRQLEARYQGREVPLPHGWGGYRLKPDRFEFWQGRENRLHDRFEYRLREGVWSIRRLSP